MDINCIDNCAYQTNGKCTLDELPNFKQYNIFIYESNCAYYKKKLNYNNIYF